MLGWTPKLNHEACLKSIFSELNGGSQFSGHDKVKSIIVRVGTFLRFFAKRREKYQKYQKSPIQISKLVFRVSKMKKLNFRKKSIPRNAK